MWAWEWTFSLTYLQCIYGVENSSKKYHMWICQVALDHAGRPCGFPNSCSWLPELALGRSTVTTICLSCWWTTVAPLAQMDRYMLLKCLPLSAGFFGSTNPTGSVTEDCTRKDLVTTQAVGCVFSLSPDVFRSSFSLYFCALTWFIFLVTGHHLLHCCCS